MKKTFIVLMMVLLATMLVVSCDDSTKLPTNVKAGDEVKIGDVTWLVLKVDEGNVALLISKDILEKRIFGEVGFSDYTTSSIRTYLNDGFISSYGLSKDYIYPVTITEEAIEKTSKSVTGEDYVFLLSATEVAQYFASDGARIAKYKGKDDIWWLRSPATDNDYADFRTVITNGSIYDENAKRSTGDTSNKSRGLRPAFWYKLD